MPNLMIRADRKIRNPQQRMRMLQRRNLRPRIINLQRRVCSRSLNQPPLSSLLRQSSPLENRQRSIYRRSRNEPPKGIQTDDRSCLKRSESEMVGWR
jgi:hypothetical protein